MQGGEGPDAEMDPDWNKIGSLKLVAFIFMTKSSFSLVGFEIDDQHISYISLRSASEELPQVWALGISIMA